MRPQFKNVPTAVSIVPGNPEELWLSDGRLENITGPALVISNEYSARTQINLQNVACKDVPVLASFRESGKTVAGAGPAYVVEQFAHGLHLAGLGTDRQIKTALAAHEVAALPAPVESDIPRLPDAGTWVNVRTLGVTGDGKTDDTAALKEAIAKHRTLYLPMGWYCVSDTLTLRPDTVLIGLHPSATVINVPEKTPAFQGPGEPKPVIEAPQGGTNIVTGIGVYTGAVNPRAVGVKWMAGANSMMNDVRLLGGHGTRVPGERGGFGRLGNRDAWNTQPASLWVTNGGGGTFKDIWTPSPYAQSGMLISDTSTSGRVYAMSLEHHVRNEMVVRNASHWRFYAVQFEEEREEGPKALPLEIDRCQRPPVRQHLVLPRDQLLRAVPARDKDQQLPRPPLPKPPLLQQQQGLVRQHDLRGDRRRRGPRHRVRRVGCHRRAAPAPARLEFDGPGRRGQGRETRRWVPEHRRRSRGRQGQCLFRRRPREPHLPLVAGKPPGGTGPRHPPAARDSWPSTRREICWSSPIPAMGPCSPFGPT